LASLLVLAACSAANDPADNPAPTGTGGSHATGGSQTAAAGSASQTGGSSTNPSGGAPGNVAGSNHAGAPVYTAGTSNENPGDGGDASGGSPDVPAGDYWKPKAGLTWQWQLSEDVGTPLKVDVYDIDWEADKATVDKLHAANIKVICYISVGSWEDFRPDAKDFPPDVIGNDYAGWPGEKYVDIRSAGLRSVMGKRFDTCKSKGFDAIEPDNQDVFELGSDSGFPLTKKDGVDYASWLATAAHSRGMGIGQKNASSITSDIAASYDWALTESCYSDGNWCGDVKAYASANKPVFMCEYEAKSFSAACSAWKSKSYSPILKSLDLDAPVTFCP
jgi:hypothetical protein